MSKKKNIMFIIPNMIGGGAQKTVSNLTLYLSKYYNIHIITFYETNIMCEFVGSHYYIPKEVKKSSFLGRKIAYIEQVQRIKKLKKSLDIICSISFLPEADILNILSRNNEKTIISIRSNLSECEYLVGVTKKLFEYSLKKADLIVSITEGVKYEMLKSFKVKKKKIMTIYNPIDIRITEEKYTYNGLNICTMGRLENVKGQWHLIRAFSEIVKVRPEAKLYILGEGSLEKYLKSLVQSYDMQDNVIFTGFVLNPYEYIKKTSLFVFPSLNEGLGNALLEVLCLGIPIISSDCKYGPRELLAPGTFDVNRTIDTVDYQAPYGVLVPVCDKNFYEAYEPLTKEEIELKCAILRLLDDKELNMRYSQSGIERTKDFSLEAIGSQWRALIDQKG